MDRGDHHVFSRRLCFFAAAPSTRVKAHTVSVKLKSAGMWDGCLPFPVRLPTPRPPPAKIKCHLIEDTSAPNSQINVRLGGSLGTERFTRVIKGGAGREKWGERGPEDTAARRQTLRVHFTDVICQPTEDETRDRTSGWTQSGGGGGSVSGVRKSFYCRFPKTFKGDQKDT